MIISPFSLFLQRYYDYFEELLRLVTFNLFSRQDKILYILDATILILYRKRFINIVSIVALNIEARQYKININIANRATLVIVSIK